MKVLHQFCLLLFLCFTFVSGVADSIISHSDWDLLLQKHVSENGNVNYEGFQKDQEELTIYLEKLSQNPPKTNWSESETMAYWINAYNANTIQLILKNYPLKSIMEINEGKAWDIKFIEIGGDKYSLNDIEHNILRKRFQDARIHFAVNCAAISCPKLNNEAFTAADLEDQLNKLAIEFINNSSKNNLGGENIQISSIFDWYKTDFTRDVTIVEYLNKYALNPISSAAKIEYKEYNWNLNN